METHVDRDALKPGSDPDRFIDFRSPGAHEWWYFDAISDDGLDAIVAVWYAALPFDPRYGRAVRRHLRNPSRWPIPDPLDFCAIGFSWYRLEGGSIRRVAPGNPGRIAQAYALNGHRRDAFEHRAEPWSVRVAESVVDRDDRGYRLRIATPDVSGRHAIRADLRFVPAPETVAWERDLGGSGSPHHWILAASDCRVEGTICMQGPEGAETVFRGRGYHDHNAGAEDLALAMRRWEWGRVHVEDETEIYYHAEPRVGPAHSLWITCRGGRPIEVRHSPGFEFGSPARNAFGLRYVSGLTAWTPEGRGFFRVQGRSLDSGPFYQRWLGEFDRFPTDGPTSLGMTEVLDGDRLHRPPWSWMVGCRLRRP